MFKKNHIPWNKGKKGLQIQSQETKNKRALANTKKDPINKSILSNELLSGIILSDGHLTKLESDYSNSRFGLSFNPNYKELGDIISKELQKYQIESSTRFHIRKTGIPSFNLMSKMYPSLTLLRNYWYPNGIKIIPKDLVITPKSLAYIFMGDGSSRFTYKNLIVEIILCTENFTNQDNQSLIEKIRQLGITFRTRNHKDSVRLVCKTKSDVRKFMNIVSPHMLDCFRYKVKLPHIAV